MKAFPFSFWNGSPPLDPTTLSLDGYWRNMSAMPWVGVASVGTSGSNNITSAGADPSASSLNGHSDQVFNGTSQVVHSAANESAFFNTTGFSGWALINVAGIGTSNTTSYEDNDTLFGLSSSNQGVNLYFRSAGPVVGIMVQSSGEKIIEASFSLSTWHLVQFYYNGSALAIRVDGGTWQQNSPVGSVASLAALMIIGCDASVSHFFHGTIAELALSKTVFAQSVFDQVRGYINARYGVSV